jgi:hypothetical protein
MRKSSKLIIVAGAFAALAVPSVASAKVERCALTTVTDSGPKSATFTVNQPKDTVSQFSNVWRHEYEVAINADGSFVGTGKIYDNGATDPTWTEDITGSFSAGNTVVSFQTVPNGAATGGATFQVTNAPMNSTTVPVDTHGTWTANIVEFQIGAATVTGGSVITTIDYKNHGEYVSAAGGGKEAAQACAGMPVNSTQGK